MHTYNYILCRYIILYALLMCIYLCADVKYADPDFTKWFCMCVYMCIYACVLLSGCAFACVRIYVDYVFNGVCVCACIVCHHMLSYTDRSVVGLDTICLLRERKNFIGRRLFPGGWLVVEEIFLAGTILLLVSWVLPIVVLWLQPNSFFEPVYCIYCLRLLLLTWTFPSRDKRL